MDILNRDRFKSNDLSVICSCWEELVDAYSAGDGCAVDVEKAKDYYKSAFSAAQSNEDIQKQMVIVLDGRLATAREGLWGAGPLVCDGHGEKQRGGRGRADGGISLRHP